MYGCGMSLGPTDRMQRLASRRLTDVVRVYDETVSPDVDPVTLQPVTTVGYDDFGPGLVHQDRGAWVPGEGRVFGLRELIVWCTDALDVRAGYRMDLVVTGDASLTGSTGTVLTVERASQRAVRRCRIRMDDDQ